MRFVLFAVLVSVFGLASCGDDEVPVRSRCAESGPRLALRGTIGPTRLTSTQADTFGGSLANTVITVRLAAGDDPHVLSFTSNNALDIDLWTAVLQRLESGATDAGTLDVSTRSADLPCDPRDGEICAVYGLDTNNDAILFGPNEVVYPIEDGEARFTEVTGNVMAADFDLQFGPITSGEEEGGEEGGQLQGCFYLFRTSDRRSVF